MWEPRRLHLSVFGSFRHPTQTQTHTHTLTRWPNVSPGAARHSTALQAPLPNAVPVWNERTGCEPYLYPFSKRYIPNTELSAPKRQAGLNNTKFSALFFITWIRPVLNLFATLEWHLSAFEAGVIQATLCQRLTKQHLQITVEYFWIHFKNKNDVELIELYKLF